MKQWFGVRFLAAAGAVLVGLLAGYWHFAEMLERPPVAASATPDGTHDGSQEPTRAAEAVEDAASPADEAQAEPEQEVAASKDPQPSRPAGAAEPADEIVPTAPATPADAAAPPSFDILRVEPNGAAVIAGRAPAGSQIVLTNGGERLAMQEVSPSGEFAIALEAPLPVGEHQLNLQALTDDGAVASRQTALVSIPPRGREEELLVAVEEADRPTRLVETPETAAEGAVASVVDQSPAETSSERATAVVEPASAPAEAAEAAEEGERSEIVEGSRLAALGTNPPSETEAATAPPAASPSLAIGAVEIENDRMYIAGTAEPDARVRLYLDDGFLAETIGGAEREFLASATADVPVGPHVVRADQIGRDESVVARVEVPFDRPAGTSMSAVAAPPAPLPSTVVAEAPAVSGPAVEASDAAPVGLPSQGGETAASKPPRAADTEAAAGAPPAQPAPAPAPSAEAAVAEAPVEAKAPPAPRIAAAESGDAAPAPAEDDGTDIAAAPSSAAETLVQPALQTVDGRVIIRRGDTLWRISKNAYGLGSRYTVIYLANGDQIRDPDLIYPGQIFRMPGGRSAEGRPIPR